MEYGQWQSSRQEPYKGLLHCSIASEGSKSRLMNFSGVVLSMIKLKQFMRGTMISEFFLAGEHVLQVNKQSRAYFTKRFNVAD